VRRLARDERADLAAFLATLAPLQWQAPPRCAWWRVRDVAAHVVSYDELDAHGLIAHVARGRFRPGQVTVFALARYDTRSPEQLLALLADHLQPRRLPAALGGRVALVEALIHHQDIRRPLRTAARHPARTAAARAAHRRDRPGHRRVVAHPRRAAGRHRSPVSAGAGPEVRGAAEALLMTIAGRRGVVRELSGPGQKKLADHIGV
jgi:uncharacterized protein (TIGR03083 family)